MPLFRHASAFASHYLPPPPPVAAATPLFAALIGFIFFFFRLFADAMPPSILLLELPLFTFITLLIFFFAAYAFCAAPLTAPRHAAHAINRHSVQQPVPPSHGNRTRYALNVVIRTPRHNGHANVQTAQGVASSRRLTLLYASACRCCRFSRHAVTATDAVALMLARQLPLMRLILMLRMRSHAAPCFFFSLHAVDTPIRAACLLPIYEALIFAMMPPSTLRHESCLLRAIRCCFAAAAD